METGLLFSARHDGQNGSATLSGSNEEMSANQSWSEIGGFASVVNHCCPLFCEDSLEAFLPWVVQVCKSVLKSTDSFCRPAKKWNGPPTVLANRRVARNTFLAVDLRYKNDLVNLQHAVPPRKRVT